jgi:thioredoxin reductase (NADPH)
VHLIVRLSDGSEVAGRAVIAATGASYRRLEALRLSDFEGNGVYYAATEIEARQCAAAPVVVVGGGNSAGQAALFMADSASSVIVAIRGDDLGASMSRYLVDRIERHHKIEVRSRTEVVGVDGGRTMASVTLRGPAGTEDRACSALFSFIGAEPASEWLSSCAAVDDHGFVLTDRSIPSDSLDDHWEQLGRPPLPYETNRPGLFAVGDIRSGSTKRVATAVGEGSGCVSSIHQYLTFAPSR